MYSILLYEQAYLELTNSNFPTSEGILYNIMLAYANAGDANGVDNTLVKYFEHRFIPTTQIGNVVLKSLLPAKTDEAWTKFMKTYRQFFGPGEMEHDMNTYTEFFNACKDHDEVAMAKELYATLDNTMKMRRPLRSAYEKVLGIVQQTVIPPRVHKPEFIIPEVIDGKVLEKKVLETKVIGDKIIEKKVIGNKVIEVVKNKIIAEEVLVSTDSLQVEVPIVPVEIVKKTAKKPAAKVVEKPVESVVNPVESVVNPVESVVNPVESISVPEIRPREDHSRSARNKAKILLEETYITPLTDLSPSQLRKKKAFEELWGRAQYTDYALVNSVRTENLMKQFAKQRKVKQYDGTLMYYAKAGDSVSCRTIIREMRSVKAAVNCQILNSLVLSYAVRGDLAGAEKVVKNIKASGIEIDPATIGILLHACSYNGNTLGIERILAEAVATGMKIGKLR